MLVSEIERKSQERQATNFEQDRHLISMALLRIFSNWQCRRLTVNIMCEKQGIWQPPLFYYLYIINRRNNVRSEEESYNKYNCNDSVNNWIHSFLKTFYEKQC